MTKLDQAEPKGQLVGPLPSADRELLISQEEKKVRDYKKILRPLPFVAIIALYGMPQIALHGFTTIDSLITLAIGTPIVFLAFKALVRKVSAGLETIKTSPLDVYKFTGDLEKSWMGKSVYSLRIGEFHMPEVVENKNAVDELEKYFDKKVTGEYIPLVSKNYRIYDSSGNSYSFIKAV